MAKAYRTPGISQHPTVPYKPPAECSRTLLPEGRGRHPPATGQSPLETPLKQPFERSFPSFVRRWRTPGLVAPPSCACGAPRRPAEGPASPPPRTVPSGRPRLPVSPLPAVPHDSVPFVPPRPDDSGLRSLRSGNRTSGRRVRLAEEHPFRDPAGVDEQHLRSSPPAFTHGGPPGGAWRTRHPVITSLPLPGTRRDLPSGHPRGATLLATEGSCGTGFRAAFAGGARSLPSHPAGRSSSRRDGRPPPRPASRDTRRARKRGGTLAQACLPCSRIRIQSPLRLRHSS